MNWYLIAGVIAVLWGAGIVIRFVFRGGPDGEGDYAAGSWFGMIIGLFLLAAGLYAITKGVSKKGKDDV